MQYVGCKKFHEFCVGMSDYQNSCHYSDALGLFTILIGDCLTN